MPDTERAIAMSDDLWKALRLRAIAEGTNASAVVRRLVQDYVGVAPATVLRSTATEGRKR